MEIKRRQGESISAFLYRFSKKVQRSGILREAKKRKFRGRAISKTKRKASALHREFKKREFEKERKMGTI
ncbi:MAG: 30S ribosomal protein S21 [Patescibacteria group bacterium]